MKKNFKDTIKSIIKFFTQDIWTADSEQVSNVRKKIVAVLKWGYLVVNGFIKDQCLLRAAALTYTLVLSIVPLLAVAFSVLKGFGFQNNAMIQKFLYDITAGREEIADNFLNFLNNTNVGALGAIGVAFLLFTVISLLGNIEKSFNVIWGVQKSRTIGKKFTDYLSVTIISPLLFIVAISATATVQSNSFVHRLLEISVLAHVYIFLLKFIPYIIVCLVLTFMYSFMPNTKVKLVPAITGGIIAGILWQVAQWGYIKFQIGAVKYNAIYGTFAQIPLFLIWIYFSWIIILLGTEISFAVQNFHTYAREAVALKLSTEIKQRLAVQMLITLTRNFESDDTPLSNEDLSEKLKIPVKLVNELLYMLEQEKIVIKIDRHDGEYFTLIRPPDKITINHIIKYINSYKEVDISIHPDKELTYINNIFKDVDKVVANSRAKKTLRDVIGDLKKA